MRRLSGIESRSRIFPGIQAILKRVGFAILVLAVSLMAQAQPSLIWQRSYESTSTFLCHEVTACPNGNGALVSGILDGPTSVDAFVMGIGDNGDSLWIRMYGSPSRHEGFTSLNPTPDGNCVFVVGSVEPPGYEYYFIWKIDPVGQVLWEVELPSTIYLDATATAIDEAGNIFIAGMSTAGGLPAVIKCNSEGEVQWQQSYDHFDRSRAEGIVVRNGGIELIGYQTSGGNNDAWLMCLDMDGDVESSEVVPSPMRLLPKSLCMLDNGDSFASGAAFDAATGCAWVAIASPECDLVLQDTFKYESSAIVLDAVSLDTASIIICGREFLTTSEWTFYVACLNHSGEVLWESSHVGNGSTFAHASVDRGGNGVFWACAPLGYALSFDVLKFDADTHVGAGGPRPATSDGESPALSVLNGTTNSARLTLEFPHDTNFSLRLHDILGRQLKPTYSGFATRGSKIIQMDVSSLPSGSYFYVLEVPHNMTAQKFVIVR